MNDKKQQPKEIKPYRLRIEFRRSKAGRELIESLGKKLCEDPRCGPYYTGMVGRGLCFQFDTRYAQMNCATVLRGCLVADTYTIHFSEPQ